jgi:hypothetical protein
MENDRGADELFDPAEVEVRLTLEYQKQCLELGLQQTRRRAGKLLVEILKIVKEPDPDIEQIRLLAEGIEFESKLARKLTLELCRG